MGKTTWRVGSVALVGVAAMTLAACGGSGSGGGTGGNNGSGPVKGGTLTMLSVNDKLQHLDPELIYTGEDASFASSWWQRQLIVYKLSPDAAVSTQVQGDLASDTGTPSEDAKTWVFKLREGATWDDGSALTCEDIAHGIARQFADEVTGGGPKYMVDLLDIPKNADGTSKYKGPFDGTGQDLFDKAVVCGDGDITFHLNQPSADFYYALIWGTGAVQKSKDKGKSYDTNPSFSGPYKIQSYDKTALTLVRNDAWDPNSDPYRPAYPDQIVIKWNVQNPEMSQRMVSDSGADKDAIHYGDLDPSVLASVFADPATEARRINEADPYSSYLGVNTKLVPNPKIREAMAVALDREQIRVNAGGDFAGTLADGTIKPNIGQDYAPTGMWTDMFGKEIPSSGDPEYAKQLIAESGEAAPTITYQYPTGSPVREKNAGVVKTSLEKAGFKVNIEALPNGDYYTIVFDDKKAKELMSLGWGADWPNASTVIGPLFTGTGSWNLSRVSDPAFDKAFADNRVNLDRAAQAAGWQDLNKQSMQNVWAIPTLWTNDQRLAGSNVRSASAPEGHNVYLWASAGTWPYPDLYLTDGGGS